MIEKIDMEHILASLYKENTECMVAVGKLCDEELDRSGALLGRIRQIVMDMSTQEATSA